ncbi:MAG: sugar phosphate isomerase/epimerase family protein [Lachnospiraceae bacterium]
MKISVFFAHILQAAEQTGKTLSKLLSGVREAGIDAVEMELSYLENHEEIHALLQEADLKVSCIYEFYEMEKTAAAVKEKERQKAERHIAMAKRVGAECILVVPGFLEEKEAQVMKSCADYAQTAAFMESNEKVQSMKEGMEYLVSLGAKAGVAVTVEDFDDYKSPVSGMQGILWFLKNVPGLRYTLDMGNFVYSEEDVLEAWELLKEYVSHVHCKDRGKEPAAEETEARLNKGLLPVAAGEGYMPIADMVAKLKAAGYDGYLAIEHFDASDQEECMKRSAAFLRKQAEEKGQQK